MPRPFAKLFFIAIALFACSAAPCGFAQARQSDKPGKPAPAQPAPITTTDAAERFVGAWTAEFMETTFLRLEIKMAGGKLAGTIAMGDIHTADDGRLTDVTALDHTQPSPIFDLVIDGDTLSFKHRDGEDTDRMQVTLTGNGSAQLRFLIPAAGNAPRVQPIELTRRVER